MLPGAFKWEYVTFPNVIAFWDYLWASVDAPWAVFSVVISVEETYKICAGASDLSDHERVCKAS